MKTDIDNVPNWGCPTAHFFERSGDPFHASASPEEFKNQFKHGERDQGWMAIDWCGNQIGFCPDGGEVGEVITPQQNLENAKNLEKQLGVSNLIMYERMGIQGLKS